MLKQSLLIRSKKFIILIVYTFIVILIFKLYYKNGVNESDSLLNLQMINKSDIELISHLSYIDENTKSLYNLVCLIDSQVDLIKHGIESKVDVSDVLNAFCISTDSVINHFNRDDSGLCVENSSSLKTSMDYEQILIHQLLFQRSILNYLLSRNFVFSLVKPVVIPFNSAIKTDGNYFAKVYLAGHSIRDSAYLIYEGDTLRNYSKDDVPMINVSSSKSKLSKSTAYYSFYHLIAGHRINIPFEVQTNYSE
jgi:hypothetical protein